jgi:hypothetical protein
MKVTQNDVKMTLAVLAGFIIAQKVAIPTIKGVL